MQRLKQLQPEQGHAHVHFQPSLGFLVALVPVTLVALTICYDILRLIPYPRPIKRFAWWPSTPFRHYLTLEEVKEIDPEAADQGEISPPEWVQRRLVLLPALQTLASFLLLFVTLPKDWLRNVVLLLSWVRSFLLH